MLSVEEIYRLITEDKTSERKHYAQIGHKYYDAEHDIRHYRVFYFNADGELVEDTLRSNIKICHPFFTELVDQCVQYMLSGSECIVRSKESALDDKLQDYFGDAFKAELSDTLTDCCCGGFGYMYAYMGASGHTQFEYADAMGVVEVREKDTDDHTQYMIYWYIDRIDKGQKKIKRIQVWDKAQTHYYVEVDEGKIILDEDEPLNPRPHIVFERDNEEGKYGDSLGYIPFFRLDNNRKQTSHLKPIKDLIDDYDLMACGLSNNLQDVNEALYVVKGFKGDSLDELQKNIKTKRVIGVSDDGDVDIKTIDIPYQARLSKLELDEKNIYHFGMGFNPSQVGDGNITNIVIQSRYALLELKCNKLEIQLKAFLNSLATIALDEINKNDGTNYTLSDVYYDLNREVMTNKADNANIEKIKSETVQIKVNTLLNAAAQLDNDTILRELCDFLELDYDEVKGNISEEPSIDIDQASTALAEATVDGDVVE